MVAQLGDEALDALIALAAPLAARSDRELLVTALVDDAGRLGAAARALNARREELLRDGVAARSASFTSAQCRRRHRAPRPAAGHRPAARRVAARTARTTRTSWPSSRSAACDVAILIGRPAEGPVLVAFSGAEHDWAAIELGAWLATARGGTLVLAGSTGDGPGRDASRLLANASIAIQRTVGVAAEPLLVAPDPGALAAAALGMGLVVVGLSRRWQQEGLGPARSALVARETGATLLVRRGLRPGGLAPTGHETRFTWTIQPPGWCRSHFAQGGGAARLQSVCAGLGEKLGARRPPSV